MDDTTRDELLSAYIDGELAGDELATVQNLLASSPDARRSLEELRAVRGRLAALPSYKLEDDFAARVLRQAERAMLAKPVSDAVTAAADSPAPSADELLATPVVPRRRWPAAVAAIAGTVAAAVLLVAMLNGPAGEREVAEGPQPEAAAPEDPTPKKADEPSSGTGEADVKQIADLRRDLARSRRPMERKEEDATALDRDEDSTVDTLGDNAKKLKSDGAQQEQLSVDRPASVADFAGTSGASADSSGLRLGVAADPIAAGMAGADPQRLLIVQVDQTVAAAQLATFEKLLAEQQIELVDARNGQSAADATGPSPATLELGETSGQHLYYYSDHTQPAPNLDALAATDTAYYVEASGEQIQATLERLRMQPEFYVNLDVDPAPPALGKAVKTSRLFRAQEYGTEPESRLKSPQFREAEIGGRFVSPAEPSASTAGDAASEALERRLPVAAETSAGAPVAADQMSVTAEGARAPAQQPTDGSRSGVESRFGGAQSSSTLSPAQVQQGQGGKVQLKVQVGGVQKQGSAQRMTLGGSSAFTTDQPASPLGRGNIQFEVQAAPAAGASGGAPAAVPADSVDLAPKAAQVSPRAPALRQLTKDAERSPNEKRLSEEPNFSQQGRPLAGGEKAEADLTDAMKRDGSDVPAGPTEAKETERFLRRSRATAMPAPARASGPRVTKEAVEDANDTPDADLYGTRGGARPREESTRSYEAVSAPAAVADENTPAMSNSGGTLSVGGRWDETASEPATEAETRNSGAGDLPQQAPYRVLFVLRVVEPPATAAASPPGTASEPSRPAGEPTVVADPAQTEQPD